MSKFSEKTPKECQKLAEDVRAAVGKVVIGKEDVTAKMLICLLAGGHVLIEDVPGIGKTTIVNALARALDLSFQRIQFTPDLMPSDVTGFNMFNPKEGDFVFHEGAVSTQILLADEINRSSPRTQSALLEAMQEGQVTVDGKTYDLPQPFMVLATQNPIEHVGTYPLPEAQLDRFMMRISIGYPSKEDEMKIISLNASDRLKNDVKAVVDEKQLVELQKQVRFVKASEEMKDYVLTLCRKTREKEQVELGVSPRAGQMLLLAAAAHALLSGREYISPDDIQELAHDVLDHRLILKAQAKGSGMDSASIITEILKETAAPK